MRLLGSVLADMLEKLANDIRSGGSEAALTIDGEFRVKEPDAEAPGQVFSETGGGGLASLVCVTRAGNRSIPDTMPGCLPMAFPTRFPSAVIGKHLSMVTHRQAPLSSGGA